MEKISPLLMRSERGWVYVRHFWLYLCRRGSEYELSYWEVWTRANKKGIGNLSLMGVEEKMCQLLSTNKK